MSVTLVSSLSNTDLIAAVGRLAGSEREATVALIVHLAEFDSRRLCEDLGFSSTFRYCREVLHLSEDAAFNRIEAARAARRFPEVLEMLADGRLSPTTLRMVGRHLTAENHRELIAAAAGKSKQEVDQLVVRWSPRPDVADSIRKVPAPRAHPPEVTGPTLPTLLAIEGAVAAAPIAASAAMPTSGSASPAVSSPTETPSLGAPPLPRPSVVRPLAPERFEIRFTASASTHEKLRTAQDLLGHAVPSGSLAEVFDRALTLLIADLERRKYAATAAPRRSRSTRADGRHIPADVRRVVAARDRHQCAFVAPDGRRCEARRFLEFHHRHPYGVGGEATVENIELRCGAHNRYAERLFYRPDGLEDVDAPNGRAQLGRGLTRSGTGDRRA